MSKKKIRSAQEKVLVLRELLENQTPISQLAEKYGLHPNDIYNWKKKLFEGAEELFSTKPSRNSNKTEEREKKLEEKLKRKDEVIAELVQENILLKKISDGEI
jgi:transposase-like protein